MFTQRRSAETKTGYKDFNYCYGLDHYTEVECAADLIAEDQAGAGRIHNFAVRKGPLRRAEDHSLGETELQAPEFLNYFSRRIQYFKLVVNHHCESNVRPALGIGLGPADLATGDILDDASHCGARRGH